MIDLLNINDIPNLSHQCIHEYMCRTTVILTCSILQESCWEESILVVLFINPYFTNTGLDLVNNTRILGNNIATVQTTFVNNSGITTTTIITSQWETARSKNVSVTLRSWWDSDRIEMIVDPVQHSAIVLSVSLEVSNQYLYVQS